MTRATLLLALLLSTPPDAAASPPPLPVEVTVRARAVAPGEPVRIVVRAPEPLSALSGRFLGATVFLAREGPAHAEGAETWSGWAAVPLGQSAGAATIDLVGRTSGGAEVAGAHAVTIEKRTFPEERLKVEPKYATPPPEVQARIEREREELGAIYARRRAVPPPAAAFVKPVPGDATGIFGARRVFNGQPRSPHSGVDLKAATGTPVVAAGPGVVVLAKDLYYSGLTVILDHGGGLFTLYAHLSRIDVRDGATVAAGAALGLSGATGRVTGPHLHWGGKVGSEAFDPRALLDPALFARP
ncbi:MAG: M23 family metallopeptidase [Acidobacteria bacterium]|nr:M23 family metallopeptidase [Acidobacteriota bacterium]